MSAVQETSPSVVIAGDKLSATLHIPPGCSKDLLTPQMLLSLITGQGVEVTDFTSGVINGLLNTPLPENEPANIDIAFAQPPVHGTNGSIEWVIDNEKQPSQIDGNPNNSADAAVSYYDRCAFVMVTAGDVIGKILPPIPGQDGRDVTGKTIAAKSGKEANLHIDESILKRADGSLVAQQDGVLYRESGKAQIRKHIQVKDYVDFSTGNINFDGDVTISRGVRDCFIVKATGNVQVMGLIEAATIETGKDLIASGGFAGRERGHVFIGGSLLGKYLDNVHGHVKHDLRIDREVINCELAVEGKVESHHGSIIGGKITPTGEVVIGTLGSGGGVITELVIGSVPTLEPFAQKLEHIIEKCNADMEKYKTESDIVNKHTVRKRMTAVDKERQTELMFEMSTIGACLDKAQRTYDRVLKEIHKRRRVDVTVHQRVYHGATFVLDGCRYKICDEMSGPVRFYMDGKVFAHRRGDAPPIPVSQIADVHAIIPEKNAAA